jgi:polar amino acid transport system permease protein
MLVATFWYLVLTTLASIGQYLVERRLARSGTGLHGA